MKQSNLRNLLIQSITDQVIFNNKATPDWLKGNPPAYDIAATQEAHELIDHFPWKWWAKTPETTDFQKKLEIADIFCFELSQFIVDGLDIAVFATVADHIETAADSILFAENPWGGHVPKEIMDTPTEIVLMNYIVRASFSMAIVENFLPLLPKFGLDLEALCKIHQAKMVLNEFRKANGYKEGTYIKMWNGKEDNHHLEQIVSAYDDVVEGDLEELGTSVTSFKDYVYQNLTLNYDLVLQDQKAYTNGS
jgi:hypothetical protein